MRVPAGLILLAAALAAVDPASKGVNFYSLETELERGRQLVASLDRTLPQWNDPDWIAYLEELGHTLARQLTPNVFTYRFRIVDDRQPVTAASDLFLFPPHGWQWEQVEPLAVAGGGIYVPLKLLRQCDREPKLAAALAHAIAHVAGRHATRLATRIELVRLAQEKLTELRPSIVVKVWPWHFERNFERLADRVASALMAEAGYDPAGASSSRFESLRLLLPKTD